MSELEAVGLVWGFKKFDYYLRGAKDTQVITDHRPLEGLFRKPMNEITNARLLRLREKLQTYDFKIIWNAGKTIPLPDYLSRRPLSSPDSDDRVLCNALSLSAHELDDDDSPSMVQLRQDASACPVYSLMRDMLLKRQKPKPDQDLPVEILHYKNFWDDLSIENELIVYDGRIVLPIPSRDRILKVIHSAHQGPDRSLVTARLRYFWPNMAKDITSCVTHVSPA